MYNNVDFVSLFSFKLHYFVIPTLTMLPTYTGDNPFAKLVGYLHVQADKHDKTSTCMFVSVRSLMTFHNHCATSGILSHCPKQVSSSSVLA